MDEQIKQTKHRRNCFFSRFVTHCIGSNSDISRLVHRMPAEFVCQVNIQFVTNPSAVPPCLHPFLLFRTHRSYFTWISDISYPFVRFPPPLLPAGHTPSVIIHGQSCINRMCDQQGSESVLPTPRRRVAKNPRTFPLFRKKNR